MNARILAVNQYPGIMPGVVTAILQPGGASNDLLLDAPGFIQVHQQRSPVYGVGDGEVLAVQDAHRVGMIESLQHRLPAARFAIDGDYRALVEQRRQDTTIGQFRHRVDMRRLLQRPILYCAVIGPFIDQAQLTIGLAFEAVIGRPPFPHDLAILVELHQQVQSCASDKIATARARDGMQGAKYRSGDSVLAYHIQIGVDLMNAVEGSYQKPFVRSYYAGGGAQTKGLERTSQVIDEAEQPSQILIRLFVATQGSKGTLLTRFGPVLLQH